jgi:hypothetical protein
MNAKDIRKGIAKAITNHLWLDSALSNGAVAEQDENIYFLEVAQVALQVKDALIPSDPTLTDAEQAQDSRAFLVECGLSESFAEWLIKDDDPNGIY